MKPFRCSQSGLMVVASNMASELLRGQDAFGFSISQAHFSLGLGKFVRWDDFIVNVAQPSTLDRMIHCLGN